MTCVWCSTWCAPGVAVCFMAGAGHRACRDVFVDAVFSLPCNRFGSAAIDLLSQDAKEDTTTVKETGRGAGPNEEKSTGGVAVGNVTSSLFVVGSPKSLRETGNSAAAG